MNESLFRKIYLCFTREKAFEPNTQVGERHLKLKKTLSVKTLKGKCNSFSLMFSKNLVILRDT